MSEPTEVNKVTIDFSWIVRNYAEFGDALMKFTDEWFAKSGTRPAIPYSIGLAWGRNEPL